MNRPKDVAETVSPLLLHCLQISISLAVSMVQYTSVFFAWPSVFNNDFFLKQVCQKDYFIQQQLLIFGRQKDFTSTFFFKTFFHSLIALGAANEFFKKF